MKKMGHKFNVGYGEAELPGVESFLVEYRELCELHGVEFAVETEDYDNEKRVVLQSYLMGPHDTTYFHIPYLPIDSSVDEYARACAIAGDIYGEKIEAEVALRVARAKENMQVEMTKHETVLKATGLTLSDGVYKLVKVEE